MRVGMLVRIGAVCVTAAVPGPLAPTPAAADVGFRTASQTPSWSPVTPIAVPAIPAG